MPVPKEEPDGLEGFAIRAADAADRCCYPEVAQVWRGLAARAGDVEEGEEGEAGEPEDASRQVLFACWDMGLSVDEYLGAEAALKEFIPDLLSRAVVLIIRLRLHERFDPKDLHHHRAMMNVTDVLLKYRATRYGKGIGYAPEPLCPKCEGAGEVDEATCSACNGSGEGRPN